ncbi:MAG: hypothetical protein M1113_00215 [Candidatus Thermoplasmatota archaeon]|nr:hypothetical protein [Candidatus Thermoplasmatota archaeon]
MGEDKLYFEDLKNVREGLKTGDPGNSVVDFLNHWRMRLSRKTIPDEINKWYKGDAVKLIEELPSSLLELDFNDVRTVENITALFNSLYKLTKISDTGASKILHIIKPEIFVMWDNEIRKHYLKELQGKNNKSGPNAYLIFMRQMYETAISICKENKNIVLELSMKLKRLYEGNLRNYTEESEKAKLTEAIRFLEKAGKPITKFLDEYNWTVITKKISIPPVWDVREFL